MFSADFVQVDIAGAEFRLLVNLQESNRLHDIRQLVVELHASSQEVEQKYNRLLHLVGSAYRYEAVGDQHTLGFPHVIRFSRIPGNTVRSR